MHTLNAQVRWESVVSKYMNVDTARRAVGFKGFRAAEEVTTVGGRISRVGGGVLGVVGLYEDAHTLVNGSAYHGTRGTIDRVMAGISVPADAGTVLLALELLPGAGEIAVGVLVVGVTAYALGNLIYDERAVIAKGIVSAASYIEDNPELLAGPAGELGKLVYDNRAAIEHAAGQMAGALANGGTVLANDLQALGRDAGEGASVAIGGLETGTKDAGLAPLVLGFVLWRVTGNSTTLLFMGMSPIMLASNFFEDRRRGKRAHRNKARDFRAGLAERRDELAAAPAAEAAERRSAAPPLTELLRRARSHAPELWERRPADPDFLRLRIGSTAQPALTRIVVDDGGSEDLRRLNASLAERYSAVPHVPVMLAVAEAGAVGLCGPEERVAAAARSLVVQAATLHSPRDLVVAAALGEETATSWDWLKWLPHLHAEGSPLEQHVGIGRLGARRLVDEIGALVAQRRADAEAHVAGRGRRFSPFVLVVFDPEVAPERALLSNLLADAATFGVGFVWLGRERRELPGECRSVVELDHGPHRLRSADAASGETAEDVVADGLSPELALECALALAPVRDATAGRAAAVPERASLLGLLALPDPSAAELADRWGRADGLHAVLGAGADGPVAVDLRADGPHGLVAGTTGAGKSELLQTLIGSLAAALPPTRLTFLLVDYKGGAAFKECIRLPHSVGLVTDLDAHLTKRALVSLNAELRRREHVLRDGDAKDLAELERRDPGHAPPSLAIVIDEFAALAREVPEFVAGVVDVAQRGRSLGVHLILATQRPAGVVNDNIKANTNLRIALRVSESNESSDVIGVGDAARIPRSRPGRCYIRTGHSELREVQAGYVGGVTRTAEDGPAEVRVRPFALAAADAEAAGGEEEDGTTDLARLVGACGDAAELLRIPPQPSPWLPALGEVVPLDSLPPPLPGTVVLGLLDEPARQRQKPQWFDLERDGSLIVYGVGGAGKTTLLRTLAVALARTAPPDELHLYGLDFASRGLAPIAALPHCGGVAAGDDVERVERVFALLRREVDRRRATLAREGVLSLSEYRRLPDAEPMPRLVLLLDGYAGFHAAFERVDLGALIELLPRLVADGRQLGIHVVLTADRRGAVPAALAGIVQARVVLRLADEDDYRSLGIESRTFKGVPLPAGRGFGDGGLELQCALVGDDPSAEGQTAALAREAAALQERYVDRVPTLEPLPSVVVRESLPVPAAPLRPVLGVGDTELEPLALDLAGRHFLVAGPYRSGRSTTLWTLAESLLDADATTELLLLAPRRSPLAQAGIWTSAACGEEECAAAAAELNARVAARRSGGEDLTPLVVVIDDADDLPPEAAPGKALQAVVRRGRDVGVHVLAAIERQAGLRSFGGWVRELRKEEHGLLLDPDLDADGELLGARLPRRSKVTFPAGRGYLVDRGSVELVQVASAQAVELEPAVGR